MGLDFQIRNYKLSNIDKLSSKFFNNVTNDFLKNIMSLYMRFQRLVRLHKNYTNLSNKNTDWLVSKIASGVINDPNIIRYSGYMCPNTSENIQVDTVYGQLTLAETKSSSKISLVKNEYGENEASTSSEVYLYKNSDFSAMITDTSLRNIINGNDSIWYGEYDAVDTDGGNLYLKVKTSVASDSRDASYITVFPLMGTRIEEITYASGETQLFNTSGTRSAGEWPIKLHRNMLNFQNEIALKIKGYAIGNDKYRFAIRDINVYKSEYSPSGTLVYNLVVPGPENLIIKSLLIDDSTESPYIFPI